jgi:preprotein translocase subunit YajC
MILILDSAAKTAAAKGNPLMTLVLFGGLAAFYFGFYRPRMKKMKGQQAAGRTFEVGDEIQTIGGLIGTVVKDDGPTVTIRTAAGHEMEFLRRAIAQKFNRPVDEPAETDVNPETKEQ